MKLNNAEDAIKQAVAIGWEPQQDWHFEDKTIYQESVDIPNIIWDLEHCFTDPLFWQALGKARGWECKRHVACKSDEDNRAKVFSEAWFNTHVWHPDQETKFWQSLP